MTQQQLQYAYFDRLHKQTAYRSWQLKAMKIQNIRNYIRSGGDPSQNPNLKDDYAILWAESNGAYFIFDDNIGQNITLIKDEENLI